MSRTCRAWSFISLFLSLSLAEPSCASPPAAPPSRPPFAPSKSLLIMGRGKVVMKRIENATTRHLTFCTRRLALLKRARELSALCDAEVALLGFSSSGSSLFEYAGPRSMQEILQAYFDTHQGEGESFAACSFPFHNSQAQVERLKEEVQRLEQEERRNMDMKELKLLSMVELEKLESELARDLNSVRQRKDLLIAEQRGEFLMKEKALRRENEILRKALILEEAAVTPCSDEETMSSADSSESTSKVKFS